jgi:two-component system chemotaxis sensor kinase CheA
VRDTEEIVVKPLQKQLKSVSLFAGATIMGDGSVALVVDVLGLAQRAGLDLASGLESMADTAPETQHSASDAEQMLLFVSRAGGQMAVPLSRVDRLEEFSSNQIEKLGAADVIQYRGAILPLIDVARELQETRTSTPASNPISSDPTQEAPIPIVVCRDGTERAGLLVGRILDIFEDQPQSRTGSNRRGVLYSSIVQGKVTEFLDVTHLLAAQGARGVDAP